MFRFMCLRRRVQVSGFKLSSLQDLSALKSYDGKTTLAQLMVQQACPAHHSFQSRALFKSIYLLSVTSRQLGMQCRDSLVADLSLCAPASLIDVKCLLETSSSWSSRLEQAVV